MTHNISMIVAVDEQFAIGHNGDQLAYISADLRHFKQLTTNHTIIMGRRTSDALPKGILPNRRNIIVTRQLNWQRDGAEIAHSPKEAIDMCVNDGETFVIGGGELYRYFMPLANTLYITHIEHSFDNADTFFPKIETGKWQLSERSETMLDEKTGLRFSFCKYLRISE